MFFDVHLMIADPLFRRVIRRADMLTFHLEALRIPEVHRCIHLIQSESVVLPACIPQAVAEFAALDIW
ncbi:MAG: hypothetical protein ACLRVT_07230 [Oscillospiraceae bacterium]